MGSPSALCTNYKLTLKTSVGQHLTSCRGIMAGGQVLGRGVANMLGGVAKRTLSTTSSIGAAKEGWLEVHGGYGSPYTRKVQAALRYKQLPFSNHQLMPGNLTGDWHEKGFSDIKPKVIRRLEDLSGLEEGGEYFPTDFLERMLKFAAEVYLPFLVANRQAINAGEKEVVTTLWKGTSPLEHRQPVFRYQDKCLTRIQTALKNLPMDVRPKVENTLGDSGCLLFLSEP